MDQVETVPDRVPSKINYRIIVLCFAASIVFHYVMIIFGMMSNNEKMHIML